MVRALPDIACRYRVQKKNTAYRSPVQLCFFFE